MRGGHALPSRGLLEAAPQHEGRTRAAITGAAPMQATVRATKRIDRPLDARGHLNPNSEGGGWEPHTWESWNIRGAAHCMNSSDVSAPGRCSGVPLVFPPGSGSTMGATPGPAW
jgi:hypothetical protein